MTKDSSFWNFNFEGFIKWLFRLSSLLRVHFSPCLIFQLELHYPLPSKSIIGEIAPYPLYFGIFSPPLEIVDVHPIPATLLQTLFFDPSGFFCCFVGVFLCGFFFFLLSVLLFVFVVGSTCTPPPRPFNSVNVNFFSLWGPWEEGCLFFLSHSLPDSPRGCPPPCVFCFLLWLGGDLLILLLLLYSCRLFIYPIFFFVCASVIVFPVFFCLSPGLVSFLLALMRFFELSLVLSTKQHCWGTNFITSPPWKTSFPLKLHCSWLLFSSFTPYSNSPPHCRNDLRRFFWFSNFFFPFDPRPPSFLSCPDCWLVFLRFLSDV